MDKKQDNTEIVERILSGARWAAVFRLLAQGISWIITIFVIRFISPSDYGLNAMLEAPLQLLMLLSTLGLETALVRSKNVEHQELRSVFGFLLVVNVLLFFGYFFGSSLIAGYFKEPRLELLAKTLAFIFLLVPFRSVPNALLARDLKFKLRAFVDLITGIAAAVTTLVLAIMGAGVWALVSGVLVNHILSALILMIFQPWFMKPSFDFTVLRELMAFGRIMTLGNSVTILSDKIISLLAGPIIGAKSLGIYSVAFELALLPLSKVMPIINPIILPAFSKFQEKRGAATYYLLRSLGIISLGIFPVFIGIACIASKLTSQIFGSKWTAVALPLTLLSLAMIFRVATTIIRPVMTSIGYPKLTLKSRSLTLIILLPLILIGVNYGVLGLVIAVMITESIVMFATIRMSSSILDTSFTKVMQCLKPAIISSAIMAGCVLGIDATITNQSNLLGLIIEIGGGVISYYLLLWIFYRKSLIDAIDVLLGRR